MNYLEHLRALRDKAHFQTEQAKAALRQQTEITESLDRLIAELEGRLMDASDEDSDSAGGVETPESVTASPTPAENPAEQNNVQTPVKPLIDEVIWHTMEPTVSPPPRKPAPRPQPTYSPTHWEVVPAVLAPAPAPSPAETPNDAPPPPRKFEFAKLTPLPGPAASPGSAEQAVSEETMPIVLPPPGSLAAAAGLRPIAAEIHAATVPTETEPPSAPPKASPAPQTVLSNIFFDANSAYLKESELAKLRSIADSVRGGQHRILRIHGLEDLASSNDFRKLLASRRILAIKKKLFEAGLGVHQLALRDIRLSETGRILEPAAIEAHPGQVE